MVGGLFSIAAIVCGAVSLTRPAMWLVLASSISSVLPYCVLLGEYCGCFAKDAPSVDIPDQAAVASFQWRGLKEKFTADKGRADVLDKLIGKHTLPDCVCPAFGFGFFASSKRFSWVFHCPANCSLDCSWIAEHGNAIIVFAGVMSACTAPVVPDKPEATVQFVIACLQALAALIIAVIVWKEKKRVDHGELFMIGTAMVMNPTTSAGGVQDREQDV